MSKITRQKRKDNFTVVNNDILQNSMLSWAAKGMLIYLLHLPDNWQINVADLSNRSRNGRDGTAGIIKELMTVGYISRVKIKNEKSQFKGYDYTVNDYTVNGKSVNGLSEDGSSVNGKSVTSKNYQEKELSEERTNDSIAPSIEIEVHDQVDDVSVTTYDMIPFAQVSEEKPNKQMQFVTEVVNYLNEKTNQQFKPTTKETIQFINSRVKLDKWELEDFKAVIDFKTKEWIKDDKMRHYLCPSTLFRASNAEKYLLTAKASKPKAAMQKAQPIKVHVEERPVLSQQDIEANEQNIQSVRSMFQQIGVRL